jgi:hypothetical protein
VDEKTEKALSSAFASATMEGFVITPKIESDCIRIVNGDLTIAEYIQQALQSNTATVDVTETR